MDAHNAVMREIRGLNEQSYAPDEPTRVWMDEDNTPDGIVESLTIIMNTGGCRWARAGGCTMCGYVAESVEGGTVAHADLMAQVDVALAHEADAADTTADQVKIYTSGSFLDDREVPPETREAIADELGARDRIVLESLPDFVEAGKLRPFLDQGMATDIAIGLETSSDRIRRDAVNKYFEFDAFETAAAAVAEAGAAADPPAGIKAYLLLKPPFLAEGEAVEDMISSIRDCAATEGVHTVSMNPTNVQSYTMVNELYRDGGYRPPWLWSVAAVLQETASESVLVVSDPVGGGADRGAHNCGECDELVYRAIKDFNLRQDPTVFAEVSCSCESAWEFVMAEETAYNQPLIS
jgi:radical SAM enzyme (TIGR01210 family)